MPVSAEKDHISPMGCGILGICSPQKIEKDIEEQAPVTEVQLCLLWSSAELRVLYKFSIPENHSRHSADPRKNIHLTTKTVNLHIYF